MLRDSRPLTNEKAKLRAVARSAPFVPSKNFPSSDSGEKYKIYFLHVWNKQQNIEMKFWWRKPKFAHQNFQVLRPGPFFMLLKLERFSKEFFHPLLNPEVPSLGFVRKSDCFCPTLILSIFAFYISNLCSIFRWFFSQKWPQIWSWAPEKKVQNMFPFLARSRKGKSPNVSIVKDSSPDIYISKNKVYICGQCGDSCWCQL